MKPTTSSLETGRDRNAIIQSLLVFLFALSLLVTGCKKDIEPEPQPTGTVKAEAGADQEIEVGQTVTLDGGASRDSDNKPLSFQWTITRKPAKSNISLTGAATPKPTFKPDETGEYELELTVSSASGKSSDRVVVLAQVFQPVAITSNITVKTLLADRIKNPELPDYIVSKSIAVQAELTINPGVTIAFERDVRMDVNDGGGVLIAKGEADKKIRFIGVQKTKGYWAGLMFYSGSNANVFEHVEIMHAGSRTLISNTKAALAMFGSGKTQLAVSNSLFAQNDGYGLYVQEGAILRDFLKNTFTGNAEAGILLAADNVAKLDEGSVFTGGNGRNVVEISGSLIRQNNDEEVVWTNFADKSAYRLLGDLTVDEGWKLKPGVTIEVARDGRININNSGYIIAKGTNTDKVTITGAARTPGYWRGLISYSTSEKNLFENAEVSNGGSAVIVSGKKTNIAVYGNKANMTIRNTRISGSGGHGIYVNYMATINTDAKTVNTFEGNSQDNIAFER